MIRTKAEAKAFLKSHNEFTDNNWIDGRLWFRFDGYKTINGHVYTILHETEGYIGVSEEEAIDYIFRNRKRLNKLAV